MTRSHRQERITKKSKYGEYEILKWVWFCLSEKLAGYRGVLLELLQKVGVKIGDQIRIKRNGEIYEGILMPRSELGDEKHIEIKLRTGYNIGIHVSPTIKIEKLGEGANPTFTQPSLPSEKPGLPKVSIISTGGTIASRVDYRTGAVRPALSASDLYAVVPELSEIAVVKAEILFSILSENMTPNHWSETAKTVARHIAEGVEGVVVAHGTDTMAYTSAALSFALQDLPVPVLLVGSQRSSDRPSSDAALNLLYTVTAAAKAPFAEVALAFRDSISDKAIAIHRGTKVRKCHTSRRDTFQSINAKPIAHVEEGKVTMLTEDYRKRDPKRKLVLKPNFEEKIALVKTHPGFNPKLIGWLVEEGYRGIILEGTGLGHVGTTCFNAIKQAVEKSMFVGMTSQCLWGRVDMKVYETGRDLMAIGVVPLGDMLPETALVKLMWAYGQTKSLDVVKNIMATNIAGEISSRTFYNH